MYKHSFPLQEEATEQTPFYGFHFSVPIPQFVCNLKLLFFPSVKTQEKKNKNKKNYFQKSIIVIEPFHVPYTPVTMGGADGEQ